MLKCTVNTGTRVAQVVLQLMVAASDTHVDTNTVDKYTWSGTLYIIFSPMEYKPLVELCESTTQ